MDQAEQLRNIIKASSQPQRPLARVITVTSGKGGVGKSNVAINLAVQFKKMGQRVIILDADFGLANIEVMFGAVPKHNLCDLIYQGKNIREIITWGPMDIGFISGGSGIAGMSNLSKDYLTYIIKNLSELDEMADIIIVDTGAGISDSVGNDAGTDVYYRFLFACKGTQQTSAVFQRSLACESDCQQSGKRTGRQTFI